MHVQHFNSKVSGVFFPKNIYGKEELNIRFLRAQSPACRKHARLFVHRIPSFPATELIPKVYLFYKRLSPLSRMVFATNNQFVNNYIGFQRSYKHLCLFRLMTDTFTNGIFGRFSGQPFNNPCTPVSLTCI